MTSISRQAKIDLVREAAENDFLTFIQLVAPYRMLGLIHKELISWWYRENALAHSLVLLPRGHQKSWLIAARAAWEITRDPTLTVLYISATERLAIKQLKIIKTIFVSKIYKRYWPDMVDVEEGKRDKWTETEISIDHPTRVDEGIRDSTILAVGLTANIVGLHCDLTILDDVVVPGNAYTEDGREKVSSAYGYLSSIENPDSRQWVVGTRYHPKDLYCQLMDMQQEIIDVERGEIIGTEPVFEIFQRQVEDANDGTGEYLWPRQQRDDNKWFGFNAQVLAQKRAKYTDKTHYRAQYYNDPHDIAGADIDMSTIQYFDRKHIINREGSWYFKEARLNMFAAIDFAFSLQRRADYTAVVVVGIDHMRNVFVLDIDRFKSDRISDYFKSIRDLYLKWGFRTLRAEVTIAQQSVVRELKDIYLKDAGILIKIDEYRPSRAEGTKEERIKFILQPRYDNRSIYHYRGGNCEILEEELRAKNPPHDDVKDALAAAIDVAVPPAVNKTWGNKRVDPIKFHERFGGVAH